MRRKLLSRVTTSILFLIAMLTPRRMIGSSWYYLPVFRRRSIGARLFRTRDLIALYMRDDAHRVLYPPFLDWQDSRNFFLRYRVLRRRPIPVRGGYFVPDEFVELLMTMKKPIVGAAVVIPQDNPNHLPTRLGSVDDDDWWQKRDSNTEV